MPEATTVSMPPTSGCVERPDTCYGPARRDDRGERAGRGETVRRCTLGRIPHVREAGSPLRRCCSRLAVRMPSRRFQQRTCRHTGRRRSRSSESKFLRHGSVCRERGTGDARRRCRRELDRAASRSIRRSSRRRAAHHRDACWRQRPRVERSRSMSVRDKRSTSPSDRPASELADHSMTAAFVRPRRITDGARTRTEPRPLAVRYTSRRALARNGSAPAFAPRTARTRATSRAAPPWSG